MVILVRPLPPREYLEHHHAHANLVRHSPSSLASCIANTAVARARAATRRRQRRCLVVKVIRTVGS